MYRLALCEDEKIFADTQEKLCRSILEKLNIEYQITVYNSSEAFINAFSTLGKRYDMLLLDIVMNGKNGMELARVIRETDWKASIIFITSSQEYALRGYDVKALHYLMKPVDGEALERLIKADYNDRFQFDFFMLESGGITQRIDIKDVVCMETVGRRVAITLKSNTVYFSGKLSELLLSLPKDHFVQCHKAFAINLSNIRELTQRDAVAMNGKIIPVSRTFAKDVKKAFARELRGN